MACLVSSKSHHAVSADRLTRLGTSERPCSKLVIPVLRHVAVNRVIARPSCPQLYSAHVHPSMTAVFRVPVRPNTPAAVRGITPCKSADLQSAGSFTDSHQACRSSAALHVHRALTAKQHSGEAWCRALPYVVAALECGDASRQDMSRHCQQPCGRLHDAETACGSCGAVNSCASE